MDSPPFNVFERMLARSSEVIGECRVELAVVQRTLDKLVNLSVWPRAVRLPLIYFIHRVRDTGMHNPPHE
jgi:hypothetical protein